jgi:hypothetical protein
VSHGEAAVVVVFAPGWDRLQRCEAVLVLASNGIGPNGRSGIARACAATGSGAVWIHGWEAPLIISHGFRAVVNSPVLRVCDGVALRTCTGDQPFLFVVDSVVDPTTLTLILPLILG